MKTYTFFSGKLREGIAVESRVLASGVEIPALVLGGGRYGRELWVAVQNPPHTGRLLHTTTGQTRSGKTKLIGVYAGQGGPAVIVRINTDDGYTRDAHGRWQTVKGKPKTVVSTSAPTSGSSRGRLGSFADGLVEMRPGDVIKVTLLSGRKSEPYALHFDAQGQLAASLFEDWQAGSAAGKLQAAASPVELIHGAMSVFAFGYHNQMWSVVSGIPTQPVPDGRGIKLGPRDTKWRIQRHEVIAVADGLLETVTRAAVAKSGSNLVLVESNQAEPGKVLVRVDTAGLRKGGRTGAVAYRGQPKLLTQGSMEHGTANVVAHKDQLWVLAEGDLLRIGQEYEEMANDYALFVKNGVVKLERFQPWLVAAVSADPEFFAADKNLAPWGRVPEAWVRRVVTIIDWYTPYRSDRKEFEEKLTGELVMTSPVTLNMGWDGQDYAEQQPWSGILVRLEADKQVRRLEGTAADKRTQVKAQAEALVAKLRETQELSYFRYARMDFGRLFEDARNFDTMKTEGYSGIEGWIQRAESLLQEFSEKHAELVDFERRVNAGEILFDWTVWNRPGGMTNRGRGWVITPEGKRRPHETDNIARHKSDGHLTWDLVSEGELALRWSCGHMGNVAANSDFEVAKMPVDGLTFAQEIEVKAIEEEIGVPNGFGLDQEAKAEAEAYEEEILSAVRAAMVKAPWFNTAPADLELARVASQDGQDVTDGVQANLDRIHGTRGVKGISVASRTGKLVGMDKSVAGGWLLFMTYHKYGHLNMNVRWLNSFEAEAFEAILEWGVFRTLPAITQEGLEGERGVTAQYAFADDEYEEKAILRQMYDDANGAENMFDGDPAKITHYAQVGSGVIELVVYLSSGSHPRWLVRYVQ